MQGRGFKSSTEQLFFFLSINFDCQVFEINHHLQPHKTKTKMTGTDEQLQMSVLQLYAFHARREYPDVDENIQVLEWMLKLTEKG